MRATLHCALNASRTARAILVLCIIATSPFLLGSAPAHAATAGEGIIEPAVMPMTLPCSNAVASISPCGTSKTVAPGGSASTSFSVTNDGVGPATFSISCVKPSLVSSCSTSPSSVHLSVGQSASVTVNFTVGTTTGSSGMDIKLTGPGADFGFGITVTVPSYSVAVTPDGADTVTVGPDTAKSQDFTVKNTGSTTETITLSKVCDTGLTCSLNSSSKALAAGDSSTVTLTYTASSTALGTMLTAGVHGVVSASPSATDDGYIVVDVPAPSAAEPVITPPTGTAQGATMTALADSDYTQGFVVRNAGGTPGTFYLSASCEVTAWNCAASADSISLAANADTTIAVAFATTGTSVGGSVALRSSLTPAQPPVDSGWVVVEVPISVSVTPDSRTINYPPGDGSYVFALSTTRFSSTPFKISVDCAEVASVDCYGWPDSVVASASEPATIPVLYTAGALNTSGTMTVVAHQVGDTANVDTGTVQVFVAQAVPCADAAASLTVSPCQATDTTLADSSATRSFTVSNETASIQEYDLSCTTTELVGTCLVDTGPGSPHTLTVAAHSTATASITYSTNAASGTGTARLHVIGMEGYVAGTVNVLVVQPVEVAPTTLAASDSAYHTYERTLVLENYRTSSTSAVLRAVCETAVSCKLDKDSVTLASGASQSVKLSYSTGKYDGSILVVAATSVGADTALVRSTIIDANGASRVAVTPDAQSVSVPVDSALASGFTIRNTGAYRGTFALAATCAGNAFAVPTSCAPSLDSITIAAGASSHVTVSYASAATVGNTGTITLDAVLTRDTTVRDGATVDVALVPPAVPGIVFSGDESLSLQVDRGLCLAIRITASAAYECGDLRVVRPLPAVRTFNKLRMPVLVYNSQVAHPHPLLAADVTLDPAWGTPDSVIAEVWIGGVRKGTERWSGTAFANGATRRVVVSIDTVTSLVDSATLSVTSKHLAPGATHSLSGTWPISALDRRDSRFGHGWSVAGVERIHFTALSGSRDIWWEAGDGSTRYYVPVPAHPTNWWYSPSLERPDTIKYNPNLHFYLRYPEHNGRVMFNDIGQQIATIDRLKDTTYFFWGDTSDAAPLDSILVPGPSSKRAAYRFYYDATTGWIDSVMATVPDTSQPARKVAFLLNGRGELESMTDPDGGSVSFTFLSSDTGVVRSITERGGTATSFAFDAGQKLDSAITEMGASEPDIVTLFAAQETRGLAEPLPPDSAFTLVNGPRIDTTVTRFWLDAFGEPVRVKNALGYETTYERTDSRWPAKVTRVRSANGQVVKATYDSRGNIASTIDSTNQGATHRYVWSLQWDFDSIAVAPESDSIVVAYDGTTGNRLWMQDARGDSTRTCFYYNADHQIESVRTQGCAAPPSGFEYDTILGNLAKTTTPLGFSTRYLSDAIGRDTLIITPVDVAGNDSTVQRTTYDIIGRVLETQTTGSSKSLYVRNSYDAAGNIDTLWRWTDPNPNGLNVLRTIWSYDNANRKLTEIAPDGQTDEYAYDAAGNVVAWTTRRDSTIRSEYDALGRQARRILPPVAYAGETLNGVTFPLYPDSGSSGLTIPGDTVTFAYDEVGNVVEANNRDARVSRTYNLDGTLAFDTLRVRTWPGTDMSNHVYGLAYEYDLDGRRTKLVHPEQLSPEDQGSGGVTYDYGPSGLLTSVTDPLSYSFGFFYDAESRLDSLSYPAGISERRFFDDDGRLSKRVLRNPHFVAGPGMADTVDRVIYTRDARGKVLMARALHDSVTNGYDGLGALLSSETQGLPITDPQQLARHTTEYYTPDALGQLGSVKLLGFENMPDRTTGYAYDSASGRLLARHDSSTPPSMADTTTFDAAGNMATLERVEYVPNLAGGPAIAVLEKTRSYYDAEGRLRVTDRRTDAPATDQAYVSQAYGGAYQDYRYDALGRRILMRTRRDSSSYPRGGTIERFVWDGSALLYEIRYPGEDRTSASDLERDTVTIKTKERRCGAGRWSPCGADPSHSDTTYDRFSGRVAYTYGSEIDAPLSVIRVGYGQDSVLFGRFAVIPLTDWRGAFAYAFAANSGTRRQIQGMLWIDEDTPSDTLDLLELGWPALDRSAYHHRTQGSPTYWFGNLLDGQRDASGLQYMRNRYYDPVSGRFTQEDPIGLAGGMNLYGFAAGDPVNYSDPFGLCPRITVSGNDVSIEGDLASFPPAAAADKTMVANGIANYWSGKIGKYNVSVNLSVKGAPPIDMTTIPPKGNLGGEGASYGGPWSGSPTPLGGAMYIVQGNSPSVTMGTAAHEFGHVMNLHHQGGMGDIMHSTYDVNLSHHATQTEIEQAIKNCSEKPSEKSPEK